MDEIAAELGLAWVSDHPQELLGTLTGFDSRMAGSDGEARAAAAVADSFREAGVRNVRRESFPMDAWERGDSSLVASAPERRAFETVALPYSPAGEVAGPLVDVGYGTPEEIEAAELDGRIALASTTTPPGGRFVHRMEKFGTASDAGAVGFVFVNHLPGQLPPTGSLTFGGEASIPAVGVSHETGERLRQHAIDGGGVAVDAGGAATGVSESVTGAEGQPPDAELSVTAATQSGESHNVVGHLGPETEERLLAVAHYDAHDIAEGALDNGCGVAVLATAARVLAAADLDRRVTVAAVGAEEVGLLGAEHLAETVDLDSVVGVCNVDGAGRFRDLVAMAHTSEATAAAARRVRERTGHQITVESEPHPFSDQWPFVRRGVPALQLHSEAAATPAATGGGRGDGRGRGWGHTHADTLDKVDTRNVREHGMLAALAIRELAAAELPRLDPDATREAFVEADFEPGMRAAGLWPDRWD